ncbi:MAG: response regulator [Tenericutes bacterium]|nr:response regulator [Mycoplasmatota bacterium]
MNALYKILLVDDEDEIRGRIGSLIDESTGFQVVGKAGNGSDAYELVEQLKPDIVLTDIKMPYIDGIELARMLKRDFPTVKVAFISGYDEFNYAREAIHLNVINYLMKPITSSDINSFLIDLKKKLDDEYKRKFDISNALNKYEETIPLIRDHEISNLIISSSITKNDLQKLKQLDFDITDAIHYGCLIETDSSEDEIELISLEKISVLLDELALNLPETMQIFHSIIIQNALFFIVKGTENTTIKYLDMFLYEILQNAEQYMNLRIHIGVSERFIQVKNFPTSYEEAKKAIDYSYFLNTGRIVYIQEVEKKKETKVVLSSDDVKKIENAVKFGTTDEVKKILEEYRNEMKCLDGSILNPNHYIISLSNLILTFSECINDEVTDIIDDNFINKMMSFSSVDGLFNYTEKVLLELRERNIQTNISRTQKIINDCCEYVNANYNDPNLSLNLVSDVLDISISYLSMLLKKNKNITFNKYVIQVRMEKAKSLLETTNEKIITIAEICGYNEVYYFSHSFKKYTGNSPKKYRELHHA